MHKKSVFKTITGHHLFLPLVCLFVALLANVIKTPDFFTVSINNGVLCGYIADVINRASELVILAIGMTLVTAASGGQDISVGAVMAVAAAVCCRILSGGEASVNEFQAPFLLAVLAALAAALLCGAFNGVLVAKLQVQPMVATLILFTAGRGIAQLVAQGQVTCIRADAYKIAGGYIPGVPIPTPIFIAIGAVLLVALVLRLTSWGLFIEAVGINSNAAHLVGLNAAHIKLIVYIICGFFAGLSGIVASSRIYSADVDSIGLNLEVDAILAVALGGNALGGGRFNLTGSVIGAFTIQALNTALYATDVSAGWLPVYKAIAVIAIITFQSGFFRGYIRRLKVKHSAVAAVPQSKEAA